MGAWFSRHLQTLVGTLGRLSKQPFATLLTVLVIGISLALPACLQVLVSNAQTLGGSWDRALDISLYLKNPVSVAQAETLAQSLKQRRGVAAVKLITADEGLKEFREYSGFGGALEALSSNPLPHVIVVTPTSAAGVDSSALPASLDALSAELRKLPEVELVQLDTAWVQRLAAIVDGLRRGVVLLAVLLAIGAVTLVSNTIRLDIQNRRDEIEVAKLVGASNGFVRRPFLYSGFWYGLVGGCMACVVVAVSVLLLRGPAQRVASLYGSAFSLSGLSWRGALTVLAAGAALGWLGSFVAASRHLKAIEPR